jgi:hypothetical protein
MIDSGATFSPCRTYRYALWRRWDMFDDRFMAIIGLNPSTADERDDDPTIRRCIGFAKREGFGGIVMLNLFAYRTKSPSIMKRAADPIGPDNDRIIMGYDRKGFMIVGVWGADGHFMGRADEVRKLINQPIYCFGLTKSGQPLHPLYLRADTPLVRIEEAS